MLDICPTPIMPDHRLILCFSMVVQPSRGVVKQTLVATSTNHSKITALYEAT
jgi:hypothetical protein